jgi:hypothetical protein
MVTDSKQQELAASRARNDAFRRTGEGGHWRLTRGATLMGATGEKGGGGCPKVVPLVELASRRTTEVP